MGRPRRQEGRRAQLVAAARVVMARDGLVGLRVREVAKQADVSPASVLYYYPDSFSLALEALTETALHLQTERAAVAASIPDPGQRLLGLIDVGLLEQEPGVWRALSEIPGLLPAHPELRELLTDMMADQVKAFAAAITDGVESGVFGSDVNIYATARALSAALNWSSAARWSDAESAQESRAAMLSVAQQLLGVDLENPLVRRPAPSWPAQVPAIPLDSPRPTPAPAPAYVERGAGPRSFN